MKKQKRNSGGGSGAETGKKARIEDYARSATVPESEMYAKMMTEWLHLAYDHAHQFLLVTLSQLVFDSCRPLWLSRLF